MAKYNLCTFDKNSSCSSCENQKVIHCKREVQVLLAFVAIMLPPGLLAFFSLAMTGVITDMWWPLISFAAYYFIMIAVIEPIFICAHCPFYAAEGLTLKCHANEGSLKLRKYNPGPMNTFEKTLMVIFAISIFLYPGIFIGYTIWYFMDSALYSYTGLLGLSGVAGSFIIVTVSCLYLVRTFLCSRCINFSCPFNSVSKKNVDIYLLKNPVMKEAWERAGYMINKNI